MPQNNNPLGSEDVVDLEGLARAFQEATDNIQPADIPEIDLDIEGFAKELGYNAEDEKKKQELQKKPANYTEEDRIKYQEKLERYLDPLGTLKNISNVIFHMFTGTESSVVDADKHAKVLGNTQGKQWLENPVMFGDFPGDPIKFTENPIYKKGIKDPKWKAKEQENINANLHRLGTDLANNTEKIRQRYRNAGLMDKSQGFWDNQWESLGQNVPYMVVGGGAAKLGFTGASAVIQGLAMPMFTLMEAGSHYGDVYASTAQKDKDGMVIEGTGDIEAAQRSIPFGLLAGSLEFWGVSQAVGLVKKLASGQLKELGVKTFAKELGKVALSEGGEEVSQDFVEQTNKIIEGIQDSYNIRQMGEAFVGGAVGGLMLGGFSIGMSANNIMKIKEHAASLAPEIDKLEKNKIITKEKAASLRNLTKEVNEAPIDDLTKAVKTINDINLDIDKAVNQKIAQTIGVIHPPHIEATAKAISVAKDIASTRPPLKGTKANDRAEAVANDRMPSDAGLAMNEVDKLPAPNILDYTINFGRNQLNSYLSAMTMDSEDKDFVAGAQQASLLGSISTPALHEVTEGVKVDVIKDATDRGLTRLISIFVPEQHQKLRSDLTLGVALGFSEAEWNFVKHNNKDIEEKKLEWYINEAKKHQADPELRFNALNPKEKMDKLQTIRSVQASARKTFYMSTRQNMGAVRNDIQDLLGTPEEETVDLSISMKDVNPADITILESSIYEDPTWSQEEENRQIIEDIGFATTELEERAPVSPDAYVVDPSAGLTDKLLEEIGQAYRAGKEVWFKVRPFVAVAIYKQDGTLVKGEPGQIHYDIARTMPIQDAVSAIHGFLDRAGNFFTSDQAKIITGAVGESVAQGVAGMNFPHSAFTKVKTLELAETAGQIPGIIFGPTYGDILSGYTGNTFNEMYDYLKEKAEVDEATKEVIDTFMPLIGNRVFSLEKLPQITRGKTRVENATGRTWSVINPDAKLEAPINVWNTFAHEAVHNYLAAFMHSDTQAAKRFNGKMHQLMRDVETVLETRDFEDPKFKDLWIGSINELQAFKQNSRAREALKLSIYNKDKQTGIDEFVASVMTDTQEIKWLTDRIKVANKTTVWTKIKKLFGNAFAQQGLTITMTRHIFNTVLEEEKKYLNIYNYKINKGFGPRAFNAKVMAEHDKLNRDVTSGLENRINEYADPLIDGLDQDQAEDSEENILENHTIDQFIGFMAAVNNTDAPSWREFLRGLNKDAGLTEAEAYDLYKSDIKEANDSNADIIDRKLKRIYNHYKKNFPDFESFKEAFLRRQWLNVVNKSAKDAVIFRGVREIDPNLGVPVYSYEMNKVKGEYIDGSGKKYNTYKHDILLEEYIPKLEVLLGLPENTFTMVYMEGFEDVFAGEVTKKSNLTGLSAYTLGEAGYKGSKTGLLSDLLWNYESNRAANESYLYVGNFTGKNTLPVLAFPSNMKSRIKSALESYEDQYLGKVIEAFKENVSKEDSEARRMSAAASALLEDMWYGAEFNTNEETKKIEVNSKIASMDMNAIMKRRRKWLSAKTGTYIDSEDLAKKFGDRRFIGTELKDNEIINNAFVFDGNDEGVVTFEYKDGAAKRVVTISMRDMLINALGTSKVDGATFYILGEFDELYKYTHGALKSGALKNLYASRPGDSQPIYIKHAMHGIHKDSMLGQFMIQNNISLLVSDESIKIGGKEIKGNISDHYNNTKVGQDKILKLKMSQWERMKEEQNESSMSGNVKQLIGGVSFDDLVNPIVAEASKELGVDVNQIMQRMVTKAHKQAETWFNEHNTPSAWMNILKDIIAQPQSPQEESVANLWVNRLYSTRGLSEEAILKKYQNVFQHPHTAEVLRNKMQQVLKRYLGGKIAGARTAIAPNIGWGNHKADVDPVTNKYNLSYFLTNFKDLKPDIARAAFPELGLKRLVNDLVESQRQESRAHTFKYGQELQDTLKDIQEERTKIFAKIKALDSERLKPYFEKGEGISVEECINWSAPAVQAWKDDMVWGTEYKDVDGTLKRRDNGILKTDGSLQKKFGLLDEQTANEMGLKPGDRYIPVVTPLSGSVDLGVVTLVGVIPTSRDSKGRKVADDRVAKFNSEWVQSILGKDFDIDTISIIPFHPDYWDAKDFNDFCDVLDRTMDIYPQRTAQNIKKILEAKNKVPVDDQGNPIEITVENLYKKGTSDPIKRAVCQAQLGVSRQQHRTVFPIMGGSFMEIDAAYLNNTTANSVALRRMHDIWSTANIRAEKVKIALLEKDGSYKTTALKAKEDGTKEEVPMTIDLSSRNEGWLDTHTTQGIQTHNDVDFPNNTNKLTYNSDPFSKENRVKTLELMWGLKSDKTFKSVINQWAGSYTQFDNMAKALNAFSRILFGDAIQLASGRHGETYENLDYYQTREQIKRAKFKLDLIDRNDKEGLKKLWLDVQQKEITRFQGMYDKNSPKFKEKVAVIRQQTYFIESFIDNMQVDDIYAYPPFKALQLLNPEIIPMPGNAFHDHLVKNTLATKALIAYFPVAQRAYESVLGHSQEGSVFRIPKDIAGKTANQIMRLILRPDESDSNPIETVRWYLSKENGKERLRKLTEKLDAGTKQKLRKLFEEFKELDKTADQPYKPIDGVPVDQENIIFSLLPREMDYYNGRAMWEEQKFDPYGQPLEPPSAEKIKDSPEYWNQQLRLLRAEASTIIQAFGESISYKPRIDPVTKKELKPSESTLLNRKAHETTYPALFKALFDNPFLFFSKGIGNETELVHRETPTSPGIPIKLIPTGRGELVIKYGTDNANKFTHNSLREEAKKPGSMAEKIYKLFTEPGGLWEGIVDNSRGSYNRYTVSQVIQLGRNIPMDKREQILSDLLDKKLYGIDSPFNQQDKEAFWISLLSMPSEQGARDNKAIGFILSKNRYDPENPLKFQSNSAVLDLMNVYEHQMLDDYLLNYGQLNEVPMEQLDLGDLGTAFRNDGIIELDETAPADDPDITLRHFLSDYVDRLSEITHDSTFLKFYNKMLHGTWQEGLSELRAKANSVVMLKALSEHGIYYKDLVADLKKLTDEQFYKKYGDIDPTTINLTIERYIGSGVADQFIRQHVGENNQAFNTRGNIISLYWTLNGIIKRESRGNKELTLARKLARLPIGYDLTALLGEKKVFGITAKDEVIGFSLDPEWGTKDLRVEDVRIAMSPFATRTYMAQGLSSLALAKETQVNRTLTIYQVAMNSAIAQAEDIVNLLTDPKVRANWRKEHAHNLDKRIPVANLATYISALLDNVKEDDSINAEVRRLRIFEIAENLSKLYKIQLVEAKNKDGRPVTKYYLNAGRGYLFDKIESLIQTHFPSMSAADKLALVAAVQLRNLYDIQVPKYISKFITYLTASRDELQANGNYDKAITVNNLIIKYQDMQEAIAVLKGNYMPHQFPMARYKELWTKEYMQAMVHRIKLEAKKHWQLRENGEKNYDIKLANLYINNQSQNPTKEQAIEARRVEIEIKKMAQIRTVKAWDKVTIGWNKGSIIPNFIPRKMIDADGYTKSDPTTHINYALKLIEGMRNDALRADWWVYQQNAKLAGERSHIIEVTRNWYRDQVSDTEMHTDPIDVNKVKKGQQVMFQTSTVVVQPGFATGALTSVTVSGVVKKVTKDEIILDIDKDKLTFDIKNDLKKYNDRLNGIMASGDTLRKPHTRQWIVLQKLVNEGYLKQSDFDRAGELKDFTMLDVADYIVLGLERKLASIEKIGTYKKADLWYYGPTGSVMKGKIGRYRKQGMVETIDAKARELKNIGLMEGHYDNVMELVQYRALKTISSGLKFGLRGLKRVTGLAYMGLAAAGKARFNNQFGALINNIVDAPIYNTKQWIRARRLWGRISHGNLEHMTPSDRELYTTLVGLGLSEDQGIMSIALEAANIKPEEVLMQQGTGKAFKWLADVWSDAVKFKPYKDKLDKLTQAINLEVDPIKALKLQGELTMLNKEWEAKVNNILSKEKSSFTEEEINNAWARVEALAKEDRKINLSKEQGISLAMASQMIAKTAWNKFYVSNFGMGFQAKAEKLRIPAFFINYLTAIDAGFSPEVAEQLGVNGVELRHAFYGVASKQSGANTEAGRLAFQFAQYQYNASSKAIRIMMEAIPQMLKFAHSRQQDTSKLKHMQKMLSYLHDSLDEKGKSIKRGEQIVKEVNLIHTIWNKIWFTAVQMSIGGTALYGIQNFADPVGQTFYKMIEFLIDMLQGNIKLGDDDDRDQIIFMLNDMLLIYGLGYKMAMQATLSSESLGDTFYKGRADDTLEFINRANNSINSLGYDAFGKKGPFTKPGKKDRTFFDIAYLTDEIASGVKWNTWTSGNPEVKTYKKTALWPTLSTKFPFIFEEDTRRVKTFGGGRYIETGGQGIHGILKTGRGINRLSLFLRPKTYIPFLNQLTEDR